jgi:hypothetical protein
MCRPRKPICKKCQALEKRAKFWRDLAGRHEAALDQIYGPEEIERIDADGRPASD